MTFTVPEPDEPTSLVDLASTTATEASIPSPVVTNSAESTSEPATGTVEAIDPGRHLSTQTEYPWRTALLHGGGIFLSFLLAVASILGDSHVQGFINAYVPGQAAGVIGFGVFCGTLAALLSRIANLSKVAALRTRLGIGPVPKS